MSRKPTGIETRHARDCATSADTPASCNCHPTYRASVYDQRAKRKVRRSFPTLAAAKAWRADAIGDVRRGKLRAVRAATLNDAAAAWLAGATDGAIRNRSGDVYKPSVIRGYRQALEQRILPDLGGRRLHEIARVDVQDLADRLLAKGLDPSTIRNAVMPLRAIFRRALARGEVAVNPTTGLELAAVRGRRDRIVAPEQAAKLLDALPESERALWATAFYAGLRLGELRALRFEDMDLAAGRIAVERSWDQEAGPVEPKSRAGRRTVPIPAVLRDHLLPHKLRSGRAAGLVFGRSASDPFVPSTVSLRAAKAWGAAEKTRAKDEPKAAPVVPITLHEARHTFASLMIAAGVNAKALSTYLGHSSIAITFDRYGHLMPGNEDEAAALLDAYIVRADTAARLAQVSTVGQSVGQ